MARSSCFAFFFFFSSRRRHTRCGRDWSSDVCSPDLKGSFPFKQITDEFDDEDIVYTKVDDSTYLFEGKTSLVDMYKVLDIDGKAFEEEKGESDSIGG